MSPGPDRLYSLQHIGDFGLYDGCCRAESDGSEWDGWMWKLFSCDLLATAFFRLVVKLPHSSSTQKIYRYSLSVGIAISRADRYRAHFIECRFFCRGLLSKLSLRKLCHLRIALRVMVFLPVLEAKNSLQIIFFLRIFSLISSVLADYLSVGFDSAAYLSSGLDDHARCLLLGRCCMTTIFKGITFVSMVYLKFRHRTST